GVTSITRSPLLGDRGLALLRRRPMVISNTSLASAFRSTGQPALPRLLGFPAGSVRSARGGQERYAGGQASAFARLGGSERKRPARLSSTCWPSRQRYSRNVSQLCTQNSV